MRETCLFHSTLINFGIKEWIVAKLNNANAEAEAEAEEEQWQQHK
jgi:hypothetical protein